MKRRIAILLTLVMMFTSAFTTNMAFAESNEPPQDFELSVWFYTDGDDPSECIEVGPEDMDAAKSEEGATITVPYGYITDLNGGVNDSYVEFSARLYDFGEDGKYSSDYGVVDLNLSSKDDEGSEYYGKKVYLDGYIEDGVFKYVITATLYNGDEVDYTFNFIEDEGDLLDVSEIYVKYCDNSVGDESITIAENISLKELQGGITVKLPYNYDNDQGFCIGLWTADCIIKDNIASEYYLNNGKAKFTLTFTSANGKNTVKVPVTVVVDEGTSAELESAVVNVENEEYENGEYNYIDETFKADLSTLNGNDEVYVVLPENYTSYDEDGNEVESGIGFESIGDVNLRIKAKKSACLIAVYDRNGNSYTVEGDPVIEDSVRYCDMELKDIAYGTRDYQEIKVDVRSGNWDTVRTYTIKVIVSGCDGSHSFGAWTTERNSTCAKKGMESRACTECLYKEFKDIGLKDHKYGSYVTTAKATFGKKGVQTATCTSCKKATRKKSIASLKTPVLSATAYTYNGSAKKPSVTVKNSSGTKLSSSYYTVKYASGRKNVGKYKVTVKMKGNYSGTKTLYFKINPKAASGVKLTGAKKALTVKWSKPSLSHRKQMTGYQIKYSTSSKMKSASTVKVKSATATSKKISKLKSQKYYYVQVRTYKKVGSSYYYSGWSTPKKVKTK